MRHRHERDLAFAIARRTLDVIKCLLREEEYRDFLEEVMLIASQEIERYEEAKARRDGGHDG